MQDLHEAVWENALAHQRVVYSNISYDSRRDISVCLIHGATENDLSLGIRKQTADPGSSLLGDDMGQSTRFRRVAVGIKFSVPKDTLNSAEIAFGKEMPE